MIEEAIGIIFGPTALDTLDENTRRTPSCEKSNDESGRSQKDYDGDGDGSDSASGDDESDSNFGVKRGPKAQEATSQVKVERIEAIGSVFVSMASGPMLRGKLLGRARRVSGLQLSSTQIISLTVLLSQLVEVMAIEEGEGRDVETCHAWRELALLLRLDLCQSLDTSPELYLPDILHIVLTMVFHRDQGLHELARDVLCNTIIGLATARDASQAALLRSLYYRVRLEICPSGYNHSDVAWCKDLVPLLSEIIKHAAPNQGELAYPGFMVSDGNDRLFHLADAANAWHARWLSLALSVCFQRNPRLQQRHLMVLQLPDCTFDGDLLFQLLTCLQTSLQEAGSLYEDQLAVTVTIIETLAAVLANVETPLLPTITWTAIELLLANSSSLRSAAVELLLVAFRRLAQSGANLVDTLPGLQEAESFHVLNHSTGVNFGASFEVSLACLLLPIRAGKADRSRTDTISLLKRLVEKNILGVTDTLPFELLLIALDDEPCDVELSPVSKNEDHALLVASLAMSLLFLAKSTPIYHQEMIATVLTEIFLHHKPVGKML